MKNKTFRLFSLSPVAVHKLLIAFKLISSVCVFFATAMMYILNAVEGQAIRSVTIVILVFNVLSWFFNFWASSYRRIETLIFGMVVNGCYVLLLVMYMAWSAFSNDYQNIPDIPDNFLPWALGVLSALNVVWQIFQLLDIFSKEKIKLGSTDTKNKSRNV